MQKYNNPFFKSDNFKLWNSFARKLAKPFSGHLELLFKLILLAQLSWWDYECSQNLKNIPKNYLNLSEKFL